jgi:glycosyltransferase involved in cell wall biosynthesis
MKLSVVIPCLNAAETIGGQLEALRRQKWRGSWEVIIADNGSNDTTLSVIKANAYGLPSLRVVDASDRRGAAHARNVGARFASGESLLFCDADDEVGDGWLAAMGNALLRYDFVASRTDIEKLNPVWIAKSLRNPQGKNLQRVSYPPYSYHAGGSTLGIKRRIHEQVGGFDESLNCLEDTDYCFRVQLLGTEFHFVPEAVLHVRYSSNPVGLFLQARLWAEYNELMYRRYRGSARLSHPWVAYVQTWCDLICRVPRALHKETRSAWMKTLGTQIGLLQGAIRFRVPPVR